MSGRGRLPKQISIPIPTDETGMVGRECPGQRCEGYFKIQPGTGLKGDNLPCICPYCGHKGPHDHFWTKEQIEYAKSYAFRKISGHIAKELKKLEFKQPARGPFGIGLSMTVKPGPKPPLRYYREKALETEVVCEQCTLRYSVFGVFAFCPDCGAHNSRQILEKNLDLVIKILDYADGAPSAELVEHLIQNALEDIVSTFDGFGLELVRVHAGRATDPAKVEKISFQSLIVADGAMQRLFGVSLQAMTEAEKWTLLVRGFQKRHLIAHKGGVIDRQYVEQSGDCTAIVGRKVRVTPGEVRELAAIVGSLGANLWEFFAQAESKTTKGAI